MVMEKKIMECLDTGLYTPTSNWGVQTKKIKFYQAHLATWLVCV